MNTMYSLRRRAAFIASVIALSAFGLVLPKAALAITPLLSANVGSGPDTAYFVLDFQDQGSSYAFAYNYNAAGGTLTGSGLIDALVAGTASNPEIQKQFTTDFSTDPQFGRFYKTFSYNGDTATPTGNGFWDLWSSTDGLNWAEANVGADTYQVQAGQYTSFSINPDFTNPPPPPPVTPQVVVPEAGSGALLLPGVVGVMGLIAVRRRKK